MTSFYEHFSFVSSIEVKKIDEALKDIDWVNAMHEKLNNFTRNQVWELVERPMGHNVSIEYARQSTEGHPTMVDLSMGMRVIRNQMVTQGAKIAI